MPTLPSGPLPRRHRPECRSRVRLAGESDDVRIIAYPTGMKSGIYMHGAEVSHAPFTIADVNGPGSRAP